MREAWNKGKKMSEEFKSKIAKSLTGKTGVDSRNWKGDKAGYVALHIWVKKHLGKAKKCSIDSRHYGKRYEWASISRTPKRDLLDWITLCPSCHRIYDKNKITIDQVRSLYANY